MPLQTLCQVKVTLLEVEPPIWRRLLVSSRISLLTLHRIIQAAMGWQDYHLFEFEIAGQRYGDPRVDIYYMDSSPGMKDAAAARLSSVAAVGTKFSYLYDFGDDWNHEIEIEAKAAPETGKVYPRCIDGARSCPPEDVGGPYGYTKLLEQRESPDAKEREYAREILSRRFDPERFKVPTVNQRLRGLGLLYRSLRRHA